MDIDLFTSIGLIVALAAVFVGGLHRLGQSSIVAWLLLGILLGPSALGAIPQNEAVHELAELGVVFLLFFIGIEFHLGALRSLASVALAGGTLQVAATTLVLGAPWLLGGQPPGAAAILGFCGALSSTAIVMKAFEERRESDSATATVCVGILIGQDLLAILALAALPFLVGIRTPGILGLEPGPGAALLFAALPALVFGVRRILPLAFKAAAVTRNQETFALLSLAACLVVAALARAIGASMALGAFVGGLVLADTPYAHQIRSDLGVLRNLALGFFFVTMGMLLDLRFARDHAGLLAAALIAGMAAKAVVTTLLLRALRRPWSIAAGAGIALAQVGEFALVLAGLARSAGVLVPETYQFIITVTVLSMLPSPWLVGVSRRFGHRVSERIQGRRRTRTTTTAVPSLAAAAPPVERAIVVGYGPVGRTLCRILLNCGIRPCVVDIHLETVRKLHAIGREAVFGDAGRREVLLAAGLREARYLLVTLPDFASRAPIITTARALSPSVRIVTRARYIAERRPLEHAGADAIATEETGVAVEMARILLDHLAVPEDVVAREVSNIHDDIRTRTGFTRAQPSPFAAAADDDDS